MEIMTAPRMILPDCTYLVTSRTSYRQFLLRPDEDTNQIFDFCLAYAAKRYEIKLIAWVVMSNHYHAVVYDEHGKVSAFIQYFHRLIAAVLNVKWERRENVWSTEETCLTLLGEEEDIIDKVAYVLANPAAAHLVEKASQWVGASSLAYLDGKPRTIKRPGYYFGKKSVVGEEAELVAELPHGTKLSRATFVEAVMKGIAAIEAAAAAKRGGNPEQTVTGVKAVLARKPVDRPKEKKATDSKLRPCVACKDNKMRTKLLLALKQFRLHHRDARQELLDGVPRPMFPKGTLSRSGHPPLLTGDRPPHAVSVLRRHLTRIS